MKMWLVRIIKLAIPVAVVAATGWFCVFLIATSPETERKAEPRLPPLVAVAKLECTNINRVVDALGTVVPAREVAISSEVEGRIVALHPALQPGGILHAGETLLKIDPEEYELTVARAEAALAEAEAALDVEKGRQRIAEREWELFGKEMPDSELGRDLMLREPQLNQAKAKIASAKSEVARAKLNLKRTELFAPFDAMVLEETVDIGQRVGAGAQIARLAGTESFWIRAAVPAAFLGAILDASNSAQLPVKVFSGDVLTAEGRLLRHLGQVDPDGRMAQVLIQIEDPLALKDPKPGRVPLPINSFVRLELDAGTLSGVLRVPREGMRENSEVWLVDDTGLLAVHPVEVLWRDESFVAVKDTLGPSPRVVVSALDEVLPGMDVRVRDAAAPAAANEGPVESPPAS